MSTPLDLDSTMPTDTATPTDTAASEVCDVCGHDMDVHDRISARFCNATQTSGLTRGCMCPAGSPKH